MRFRIDDNLKRIASVKGASVNVVSVELCAHMVEAGIIEDVPDNWGESVLVASGPQYVRDVCDLLSGYLTNGLIKAVKADVFSAFCALIIVGDGDCPHCGGELRYCETEGHELKDGDYYTPNSWVPDLYVYKCANCGEIVKTSKEL